MKWWRLGLFLLLLAVLILAAAFVRALASNKKLVKEKEKLILKADSLHSLQLHTRQALVEAQDSLELLLDRKR